LNKPLGGRYKVVEHLGEGGFGCTFLAEDLHLPSRPRCVVKQLKPSVTDATTLQTARRLFETEAQVLYRLGSHNQIPRLLAHFEDKREFYLAMEWVEGKSLKDELIAGQPWPEANVVALLRDILKVLAFVHEQGVIHRDVKPANLICRYRDGKIVLIDFGAVKQAAAHLDNPEVESTVTITIGTQGYMPSEQLAGNPRFSSDIYAVGMIGIQALTGIKPKDLIVDPDTAKVNWHQYVEGINADLLEMLDCMVHYHFKKRYQTAAAALEVVDELIAIHPELGTALELTLLPSESSLDNQDAQGSSSALQPSVVCLEPAQESSLEVSRELPSHLLPPLTRLPELAPPFFDGWQQSVSQLSQYFHAVPWGAILSVGIVFSGAIAILPKLTLPNLESAEVNPSLPALPCHEPPAPPVPTQAPDFEYPNGIKYYGPFEKGLPANGRGTMVFPNGDRYDGDFKDGKRNGCGTFTFANGRSYMGQFQQDQLSGLGVWVLENGNHYIGEFKDNHCHGNGTFVFADGASEYGVWQDGKLVGGNLSCIP
jgi:serine/threonine protein kinase